MPFPTRRIGYLVFSGLTWTPFESPQSIIPTRCSPRAEGLSTHHLEVDHDFQHWCCIQYVVENISKLFLYAVVSSYSTTVYGRYPEVTAAAPNHARTNPRPPDHAPTNPSAHQTANTLYARSLLLFSSTCNGEQSLNFVGKLEADVVLVWLLCRVLLFCYLLLNVSVVLWVSAASRITVRWILQVEFFTIETINEYGELMVTDLCQPAGRYWGIRPRGNSCRAFHSPWLAPGEREGDSPPIQLGVGRRRNGSHILTRYPLFDELVVWGPHRNINIQHTGAHHPWDRFHPPLLRQLMIFEIWQH